MKLELTLLLIAAIASIALAAPQAVTEPVPIVAQSSNQEPDGSYVYSYETGNGIKADETGTLKKASSADTSDVIVASGSFSYTAPTGELITITYVADDVGGFQPQGDHLPTPPPIPAPIQKALDYLASLPPAAKRR